MIMITHSTILVTLIFDVELWGTSIQPRIYVICFAVSRTSHFLEATPSSDLDT